MGASDTSNVSNSAKQWPPSRELQNKSPVTHLGRRKREKWGLSTQPTRLPSYQHVRQSGKVCCALLALCYMVFDMFHGFLEAGGGGGGFLRAHFSHMFICEWSKAVLLCYHFMHMSACHWKTICNTLVHETQRLSAFSVFHFPLASCSLYHLPLSVCPLGQDLWTSATERPFSGSSGVCRKIPTWTQ